MKEIACDVLFEKGHTVAEKIFEGVTYPYEVLPKISEFILELGKTLPADKFECREDNIWIAKSASVAPSAYIHGPAIIDEEAEIRHCAFIRGNAIVGKGAVVGNSTELKTSSYLIRFRFLIITMYEIRFWDLSPIWEPAPLHPM